MGDPDLIFLDEPTTGFDPAARRQAWSTIRSLCELGDIPEVPAQSRTLEADRVLILTTEPVLAAQVITTWAIERDVELTHFSVSQPTLEDIYLELTGSTPHDHVIEEAVR